ncbi:MAG: aminopeptidase [Firmicutes bacterium]|nr:aminopeptidase [Bacillota bacterium]
MNKINMLSKKIVEHSLKIDSSDKVLITYQSIECHDLVLSLINDIAEKGAVSYVKLIDPIVNKELLLNTNEERAKLLGNYSKFEIEQFTAFISIRYSTNDYEDNKVSSELRNLATSETREYDEIRINNRKWVLLNYPSILDAHKSKMNSEQFKNFALDAMTTDYDELKEKLEPLKKMMENTDKVRIVGPNTDITFSIKEIPVVPCCGESNLPDGEIFTAPVKDSVNGIITYNVSSPYQGEVFSDVSLTFKNGKIIDASCSNNQKRLQEILDTDDGSRYIGEFSIGLNPNILHPMGDILYDEKIIGSIHFTPGQAYHEADNGNRSRIHWDLVLIQRGDYGGGEIYFDDILVRKDGIFVLEELKQLNLL